MQYGRPRFFARRPFFAGRVHGPPEGAPEICRIRQKPPRSLGVEKSGNPPKTLSALYGLTKLTGGHFMNFYQYFAKNHEMLRSELAISSFGILDKFTCRAAARRQAASKMGIDENVFA